MNSSRDKHLEMLQKLATKSIISNNSEVWNMQSELSEDVIRDRSKKIAEFIMKQRAM